MDVGTTDIVSFKDKILMMIRDRGHALTVDIDIKNIDHLNDIISALKASKVISYVSRA